MSESMKTAFLLIGIFFTLMLIGLGYTLKLAIQHSEPILDESYYEKGLDYQAHIDSRQRASELGFRIESDVLAAQSIERGKQIFQWTLVVPDNWDIEPGQLQLRVVMDQPATSKYRQVINVSGETIEKQPGLFRIRTPVALARPGYWDLTLEGTIQMNSTQRKLAARATASDEQTGEIPKQLSVHETNRLIVQ